eukprot:219076-Prymnesium_polylepis.1
MFAQRRLCAGETRVEPKRNVTVSAAAAIVGARRSSGAATDGAAVRRDRESLACRFIERQVLKHA